LSKKTDISYYLDKRRFKDYKINYKDLNKTLCLSSKSLGKPSHMNFFRMKTLFSLNEGKDKLRLNFKNRKSNFE